MLITLLSNLFRKKKVSTSLNCGIFAWVGTEPKNFSPVLFNILGVYNDSRGGDSCGVYFNRGVIHGIGAEARYEAMVKTQKLHTTVKPGKWPVVLGHCRKASVGTVTSENSQPILVRNEKENRLLYVQAHNGTISNHKELAAKYKESFTHTESDSSIIARLIQKHGFDILKEYEGSAALVMHFTKDPNSLYAFHGESYKYNVKQEERPLHYVKIPGSGTYISSEAPPLEFIANGTKATSFKFNVLYKLTGNEVEEIMTIEREVKKPISVPSTTYRGSGWSSANAYGYNDEFADNVLPFRDKGASCNTSYSTKGVVPNIVIASEVDHVHNATDRILWHKGAYRVGERLCHGKYVIDTWGYIQGPFAKISTKKFVLYFFYGVMVSAIDDFYELEKYARSKGHTTAVDIFQSNNWAAYSEMLGNTAISPFTKIVVSAATGYMEASLHCPNAKGDVSSYFTGEFQPLFGMYTYDFENGNYVGYTRETSVMTLTKFLNENTYLDEFHFAQDPVVDAYAEDCRKRLDEGVDDTPTTNLPGKADEEDHIMQDCNDCEIYKDPSYDGGACLVCQVELGKTRKSEVAGLFRDKAAVDALIKGNLPAIVDDLEQFIGELDETKKTHLIVKEYAVLTDARKKLKEIKI